MPLIDLISNENEVFRSYVFWSALLILKMLATGILTSRQRFRTKTFANPEDVVRRKAAKVGRNEDVERVRRAHRNDLENVLILILIGFLYTLTNPTAFYAIHIFRAAALGRLLHTLVYAVVVIPQPARGIAFVVPQLATAHMAVATIWYFL